MLLLDENNNLVDYDVMFKKDDSTRNAVELKLQELLSKPVVKVETETFSRNRNRSIETSFEMENKLFSPLVSQIDLITETVDRTTRSILYPTPFTIAFLWNKSLKKWGFNFKKSWYNNYLDLKSRTVDTNNLSLLLDEASEEKREFISKLKTRSPRHFELIYPDMSHFSSMFPLTEFSNTGQTESQIVEMYGKNLGESPMDKLSRLVDLAKGNTRVLSILNLQPNIIK